MLTVISTGSTSIYFDEKVGNAFVFVTEKSGKTSCRKYTRDSDLEHPELLNPAIGCYTTKMEKPIFFVSLLMGNISGNAWQLG